MPVVQGQYGVPAHQVSLAPRGAERQVLTGQWRVAGGPVQRGWISQRSGLGHREHLAAQRQLGRAMTVAEQAEVTDAYEARGQDVEEEAAAERRGFARHDSRLGVVASIPPAARDVPRVECESAMSGDGDRVGVTAARLEPRRGPPDGGVSLDDPCAAPTTCQQVSEGWGIGERVQVAVNLSPAVLTKLWQALQTQPATQAGQHAHGKQEARTASQPTLAVWGYSAPGHDARPVGRVKEVLSPGVEAGEKANPGAQVCGISSDAQPGWRRGLEPEVVHDPWVVQGQGRQRVGEGQDDVARLDRPQFTPALLQPLRGGQGRALGTLAMTTGVGGDGVVTTMVALIHVAAQGGGAPAFNGAHGAVLLWRPRGAVRVPVRGPRLAEDIGDCQRGCRHQSASGLGRKRPCVNGADGGSHSGRRDMGCHGRWGGGGGGRAGVGWGGYPYRPRAEAWPSGVVTYGW